MSYDQTAPAPAQPSGVPPAWEQPPERKRLGCGCKLAIALVIVFVLMAILCCGGVIWFVVQIEQSMSEEPEAVIAATEKITPIEIPEGLEPRMCQDFSLFGQAGIVWVLYVDQETNSRLFLTQLDNGPPNEFQEAFQESFLEGLSESELQEDSPADVGLDWKSSDDIEVEISGAPVGFDVKFGEDADGNVTRVRIEGKFDKNGSLIRFFFSGDAEAYDESTLLKMLESIP